MSRAFTSTWWEEDDDDEIPSCVYFYICTSRVTLLLLKIHTTRGMADHHEYCVRGPKMVEETERQQVGLLLVECFDRVQFLTSD